jgi:hypothetical protein
VKNPADSTTVRFSKILPGAVDPDAFATEGFEMFDTH